MKKFVTFMILALCLLLASCDDADIGIIGGADGPTKIIVSEKNDNMKRMYDVDRYFRENYVDEHKLPVLDIHIPKTVVSDDRTLVLEDSVENNLELMIYEYYHNIMSGSFNAVKDAVAGKTLLMAIENEEKSFKDGIYYNRVVLDEIDIVDRDDLDGISGENKQSIIETLNEVGMTEFAIVEVEKTIKHNEKSLSMGPQTGDGEVTRYYLLGKNEDSYKIIEVYWEGFIGE